MANDDEAVADIVGSILLVGITVAVAVGLGLLLLAYDGPEPSLHVELAVELGPGLGGWGTGDETVRVRHLGGDALAAEAVAVHVALSGTRDSLTGAALGSAWADGQLTVGESWERTYRIEPGAAARVDVVHTGASGRVLAHEAQVAGATSVLAPCAADSQPPKAVLWTQVPATLTGTMAGGVTVTVQLTDSCWGVNPGVTPSLLWRWDDSGPHTDQGPMAPAGSNRWTATIPAQAWSTRVGQVLQYHAAPVADLAGNIGATAEQAATVVADCSRDSVPPVAESVAQVPADVRSSTTGPVQVTVVAADDCAGVDPDQPPVLQYRTGASDPFVAAAPMQRTGQRTWTGTIPDLGWASLAGRTLQHQVTGIRDLNGNVGASAVASDLVDPVYTYTYVGAATASVGTLSAFANAQSGTDNGAEASAAEAGTPGSPTTQVFNANGAVLANGWTSPGQTAASDNAYASFSASSPTATNDLIVQLADPVAQTGSITRVILNAEVSVTSWQNDAFRIQACLAGGTCNALSPQGGASATDVTLAYDVTSLRPGGGSWSWADIVNLQGVVSLVQSGARDGSWRVDRVWVDVTSVVSSYALSIQFDWSGVPAGTSHTLEVRHRAAGETFAIHVWDGSAWTPRGATLTPGGDATWSYTLTAAELRGGSPRIRIVDTAPAGTTQGTLAIDWMRVATL